MLKKIIYFIFVSAICSCTSVREYNFQITEKKHNPEELRQDLTFTYKILQENHPGIYWYVSKQSLDKKYDSVKNTIVDPLTTAQFYSKIAPFVASIKCGHTAIRCPSPVYNKETREQLKNVIYPLDQYSYTLSADGKLYVIAAKNEQCILKKGTEIIDIDGVKSRDIVDQLTQLISSDGYNQTHHPATLSRSFAQRYHTIYGKKDSLAIRYKAANDSIYQIHVKLIPKSKNSNVVKGTTGKSKKVKDPKYRGKLDNGEYQLDFKFLDNQFAYVKIKSFSVPNANYEMFYKGCFDSIQVKGCKNLIIDLRDNGGGSLDASRNLFAYLTDKPFVYLDRPITKRPFDVRKYGNTYQQVKYFLFGHNDQDFVKQDREGNYYSFMKGYKTLPPHKNNFKGNVYVLINGYTFSAASLLSANLQAIKRATFVGEETGGGFDQCVAGKLPIIALKKSKLLLRFGLYRMAPVIKGQTYGRGVFPDVNIVSTINDKLNGVDQELNWVINHQKNTK